MVPLKLMSRKAAAEYRALQIAFRAQTCASTERAADKTGLLPGTDLQRAAEMEGIVETLIGLVSRMEFDPRAIDDCKRVCAFVGPSVDRMYEAICEGRRLAQARLR